MLSYIIPPIVIVLSLAALIFFLFRKSATISEELILKEKGMDARGARPDTSKLFRFTQLILQLTERIMQRFKLFSLRFYNRTDGWFHSIKEKREQRSGNGHAVEASQPHQPMQTPTPYANEEIVVRRRRSVSVDTVIPQPDLETDIEPMISKEVVRPDSYSQQSTIRNEFEKALIERIAFNPKDIEAYERLGDYYIEVGNFTDSLSCFEEVLKLSPANRRAKIKAKRLQKIVFSGLGK